MPHTYVNECPQSRSAHEDPVHLTGFGVHRKEVGPVIVLSEDGRHVRVTVTPEKTGLIYIITIGNMVLKDLFMHNMFQVWCCEMQMICCIFHGAHHVIL